MDNTKIIEKGKQSLSFVEQLQNQIQLCREAMSEFDIPITPKVEALEGLLWAKLKDDEEYKKATEELTKEYIEKRNNLKKNKPEQSNYWFEIGLIPYKRDKAIKKFRAIMCFIDKKGYMPIGEENE